MPDWKAMYLSLMRDTEKAIRILEEGQRKCEELYLQDEGPHLQLLPQAARSEAERAEGGTSGTLVTEILGAPQRETVKKEQAKCVPAPRPKTHPRHGTAVPTPAEENSVPEGRAKPAQAPVRRPPYSAEARRCRSAPSAFFSSTGRGAFSFWARLKGAPAAPRAVGRGGAGERAQFSPQAETELSGLCDDDNGGRTPVGTAPCGSRNPPWPPSGGPHLPGRRITAPTVLPGACTTGPMRASAPTGAPFTPACRCAPPDSRW